MYLKTLELSDKTGFFKVSAVGAPRDAVSCWVEGVQALALGDAVDLGVFAAEGGQGGGAERAEGRGVPGFGDEGAVLEGEDERVGNQGGVGGGVFRGVVGEGDGLLVPPPVGVPGLGIFVVPLLLEDRRAVSGELDEEDAMDFGGEAAAAGVEAFEFFCGVGRDGEKSAEQKDDDRGGSHGRNPTQRVGHRVLAERFERLGRVEGFGVLRVRPG